MAETLAASKSKHSKLFWLALGGCFVLFIALAVIFYREIDPKAFHVWATKLSGWVVFLLLIVLPLVGFPVSILFVVTGAKFGSIWGLGIVALAIAIHLLCTYFLTTKFLHDWISALFARTRYRMPKIPPGDQVSVTLLTTLVPGVPYAAKNYLLVLAGVPFRSYFLICLPAHVFHASLAIFFGDLTRDLSTGRVIFLSTYAAVIILLGRHVIKRLRARNQSLKEP